MPTNTDHLALIHLQIDVVQNRTITVVTKVTSRELDTAFHEA
jgi:hypothetical protein